MTSPHNHTESMYIFFKTFFNEGSWRSTIDHCCSLAGQGASQSIRIPDKAFPPLSAPWVTVGHGTARCVLGHGSGGSGQLRNMARLIGGFSPMKHMKHGDFPQHTVKKKQRVESVLLVACFDGGIYILRCRLVMCGLFLVHDPSRHMSLTHRNCQEVWVPGSVVCVQRPAFRFVFHPGRGSGRS